MRGTNMSKKINDNCPSGLKPRIHQEVRHLKEISKEYENQPISEDLMIDVHDLNEVDNDMTDFTLEVLKFNVLQEEFGRKPSREKQDECQTSQDNIFNIINRNEGMKSFLINFLVQKLSPKLDVPLTMKMFNVWSEQYRKKAMHRQLTKMLEHNGYEVTSKEIH